MSFSDFLKRRLAAFFITVTCITAATGILGILYDPDAAFGYGAFFSPLIMGFIATLPSFILYSGKELKAGQMLFRKILHFVTLEALLIGFGFSAGIIEENSAGSFALSIFLIWILVSLALWLIDRKKAKELTTRLKLYQQK